MNGTAYTEMDTVAIYNSTLHEFMANHKDFIGAKLIYAPIRGVNLTQFETYMQIYKTIKVIFLYSKIFSCIRNCREFSKPVFSFVFVLFSV